MSQTKQNILFRFDSGAVIGHGHLARCRVLAKKLAKLGWQIHTASRMHLGTGDNRLVESQNTHTLNDANQELNLNDESSWLGVSLEDEISEIGELVTQIHFDWVVLDHYAINEQWIEQIRELTPHSRFIAIDDTASRKLPVEIILNNNLLSLPEHYLGLVPEGCTFLTGTHYALLELATPAKKRRYIDKTSQSFETPTPLKIIVAMGATDPNLVSEKVCKALELGVGSHGMSIDVVVALSSKAGKRDELENLCKRNYWLRVEYDADLKSLNDWADIAIGACGVSAWERAAVGLPALLITTAQNQVPGAERMAEIGANIYLGHWSVINSDHIVNSIKNLSKEKMELMAILNTYLLPTSSVDNVVKAITDFSKSSFSLRVAEQDDAMLLYQWQCQSATRQFFRNPSVPKFSDHIDWFERQIKLSEIYIIEANSVAAGYVRLDSKDAGTSIAKQAKEKEVSILIADGFKGQKLAQRALKWLLQDKSYWNISATNLPFRVVAEVAEENIASHRAFTAAGFSAISSTQYESFRGRND